MRETRPSGSVEGVMSNHDPYSDFSICPCLIIFVFRGVRGLGEPTVSTQNLRVHPTPIWSGQEGANVGNVVWLSQAFQRRRFA